MFGLGTYGLNTENLIDERRFANSCVAADKRSNCLWSFRASFLSVSPGLG